MAILVILRLELLDVYGDHLKEKIDNILRHQVLNQVFNSKPKPSMWSISDRRIIFQAELN
jgi:hypothetical protein